MLKSYEAIYENGQLKWLSEQPQVIIVTVLEEELTKPVKRRIPPTELVGKIQVVGDIVGPIVDEEDWECLK